MKKNALTLLFLLGLFAGALQAQCVEPGQIRKNGGRLEFCNGTNWKLLGKPQIMPTNTGCATTNANRLVYNAATNNMEFCDTATSTKYLMDCSTTGIPCTVGSAGAQIYNAGLNMLQFCNGTQWVNMGSFPNLPCCPDGFVHVPADPARAGTTQDFCVSKYHMKALKKTNGVAHTNGNVPTTQLNDYYPASVANDRPWSNTSFQTARAKCSSLGPDFHLITNPEWMTIAINIENSPANWTGSAVGSGHLPTGHSDGSPNLYLPASSNDIFGCFQTNNGNCLMPASSDSFQKRTFLLSNGETIWDMAGNINSWVSPNLAGSVISYAVTACNDAGSGNSNPCVQEINDDYNMAGGKYAAISPLLFPEASPTPSHNYRAFYPSNLSGAFYSTTGIGLDYHRGFGTISWRSQPTFSSAPSIAMYRGGSCNEIRALHPNNDPRKFINDNITYDRRAGIFSAWLIENQTTRRFNVGFRCVYTPSN